MTAVYTPHEFVAKWRSTTLKERAASQEHKDISAHDA
jgi:hypothetical protein